MRVLFFFIGYFSVICISWAQDLVNNTNAVYKYLQEERKRLVNDLSLQPNQSYALLSRLLDIGSWNTVQEQLDSSSSLTALEKTLLQVKLKWLNNDFHACQELLEALPDADKSRKEVECWKAMLDIEAWKLEEAEVATKRLLRLYPLDIEVSLILGRSLLLQKKYQEALVLSTTLISKYPNHAAGYFLKADICFWNQNPKEAEESLIKGLQIEPLHADARFYYGYAIWRRIDATQLNDMVNQWELALALNPLHFQTHWHLGNGHTNQTFADYVDKDEKEIRAALERADDLFTKNQIDSAFDVIAKVKVEYPQSVLPDMHKASLLYGDFDAFDRKKRLDEAEQIFIKILEQKKHYGPAHNGLSAVIKSKRIPFLKTYESIIQKLKNPEIDNLSDFLEIFPDVGYYPGNVAKGMVWNQLYTSVVYFPFLAKQHRSFVIPPLHKDLAIAMRAPYFRFNTTFDNRQWMDIRGVGSGAAAIEYVERGAFEERNVLLHEYVHLFHGQVLTDEQNRKIKALYYNAMEKGLTLDYYSQNNESEYFAQTYPAYFEKVKVHPLDFKSMNTLSDLSTKDPEMYAFLDQLIRQEQAYLAGDKKAMASNWAQVYLNLANNALKASIADSYRYLDTALMYDPNYLPVHLAYAKNNIVEKKFEEAKERLHRAKAINSSYAPIYVVEGDWLVASAPDKLEEQAKLYRKAYELEKDYMIKAQNNIALRNFYYQRGYLAEAIAVAEEYAHNGSSISTYLRDRKNDAKAFVAWQKGLFGDKQKVEELANLVAQKPFNYNLRIQYIEVLIAQRNYQEALKNINEVYRNLQATQIQRPEFELLYVEVYAALGDKQTYRSMKDKLLINGGDPGKLDLHNNLKLVSILIDNGDITQARSFFKKLKEDTSILNQSLYKAIQAKFSLVAANERDALKFVEEAIKLNPYNVELPKVLSKFKGNYSRVKELKQRLKTI